MRQFFSDIPLLIFAACGLGWLAWGIWYYGSLVSVPLAMALALFTFTFPVFIGLVYSGRFRLWHLFVWITLFAAVLAWFTQSMPGRKRPIRQSAAGLNSPQA